MEISYLGHSTFKLKGKKGTVITDPYGDYVGFALPSVSADMVTVSHHHPDHDNIKKVGGTARRAQPFIVDTAGEYEVGGISIFGVPTFHDDQKGSLRGTNIVFTVLLDELRVCHLGDLGHPLTNEQIAAIGEIDVLLCPVGGHFTINPSVAVQTIQALEPSYVIPMHFKTPAHDEKVFADLVTLADFLKEYGAAPAPVASVSIDKGKLPEETELVVLQAPH
jgi:L-ascorbate metabolism protein UlaG (beta-lactamase superfamily)